LGSDVQLRFKDVEKSFSGSGSVLSSLTFEVAAGEVVALLGPSGCGKSTVLRLAAGLETPDQGRIDRNPNAQSKSGFVFQDAHLLSWRTVLENARLPLEFQKAPIAREQEEHVLEILSLLGLADSVKKLPHQLSGGMKMRVSLARALVANPGLLLFDEPFAALDEFTRNRLQFELREFWRKPERSILFVTHSVSEAVFVADRILVFSHRPGRLVREIKTNLSGNRSDDLRFSAAFNDQLREVTELALEVAQGGRR